MAAQDIAKPGQVSDMKQTAETPPNPMPPPPDAILEADLQAQIGRQLRAVYDEVVNEGVPDRFVRLLEELERKKKEGAMTAPGVKEDSAGRTARVTGVCDIIMRSHSES